MTDWHTTVVDAVGRLARSLDDDMERLLVEELKKRAEPILRDLAREMLRSLKSNIVAVHDCGEDNVKIVLRVDGFAEDVGP